MVGIAKHQKIYIWKSLVYYIIISIFSYKCIFLEIARFTNEKNSLYFIKNYEQCEIYELETHLTCKVSYRVLNKCIEN